MDKHWVGSFHFPTVPLTLLGTIHLEACTGTLPLTNIGSPPWQVRGAELPAGRVMSICFKFPENADVSAGILTILLRWDLKLTNKLGLDHNSPYPSHYLQAWLDVSATRGRTAGRGAVTSQEILVGRRMGEGQRAGAGQRN